MKSLSLGSACLLALLALPVHAAAPVPLEKSNGVLVDGKGMTVYTFDKDTANSGKSACTDRCAENWPPVPAGNAPVAAPLVGRHARRRQQAAGLQGQAAVHLREGQEAGRQDRRQGHERMARGRRLTSAALRAVPPRPERMSVSTLFTKKRHPCAATAGIVTI